MAGSTGLTVVLIPKSHAAMYMEGFSMRAANRTPPTTYSFSISNQISGKTLVLSSSPHSSAYLLTHTSSPAIPWRVTATKGESRTTQTYAWVYSEGNLCIAILAPTVREEMAFPALEFILATTGCDTVLALGAILANDYIGDKGSSLKRIGNAFAKGGLIVGSELDPGNMLRGATAAALLVAEIKKIRCEAYLAIVQDHVLSTESCELYTPIFPDRPRPPSFSRGISSVEQTLYSHNVYL